MTRQSHLCVTSWCLLAGACCFLCSCREDATREATTKEANESPEPPKARKLAADPLHVSVTVNEPRGLRIVHPHWVSLECTVRNITTVRQEVWMWSCSRYQNWITDNSTATIRTWWSCESNYPRQEFLEPNQSMVQELEVEIYLPSNNEAVSFRVGFAPFFPPRDRPSMLDALGKRVGQEYLDRFRNALIGPFWSEPVTIHPKARKGNRLVSDLRRPENRLKLLGTSIPGGEIIVFSPPMKQLIRLGAAARAPLHRLIDDKQIQNEVVLVLGAVGDETTIPLLIDRYPRSLDPGDRRQTKMVCFSFALSYLTGQQIDRTRWGTTFDKDNARLWRKWWVKARPTFHVPAEKPKGSWMPSYP